MTVTDNRTRDCVSRMTGYGLRFTVFGYGVPVLRASGYGKRVRLSVTVVG